VLFEPATLIRSTGPLSISYLLKQPAQRVTLTIVDSSGTMVRQLSSDTAGRTQGSGPLLQRGVGLQRVNWAGRYTGASTVPGMILWGATTIGPAAPPGRYTVRLNVDGAESTQIFRVRRNPHFADVSDADLRAQFALAIRIRDKVSEANDAVILARAIKTEVDDRVMKNGQLSTLGSRLKNNLSDVEDDIYQVKNQSGQDPLNFPIKINNRLANLNRVVNAGDGAPIANAPVLLDIYSRQLAAQTTRLQGVITTDLAAFNAEAQRLGVAVINPRCPGKAVCGTVP
jgi:hypothetical protein